MWSSGFSKKYFVVCNLLKTFTPAIKLTFGRNRFCKSAVYSLQTRIHFLKKSRDHVDNQLHLSKFMPNVSLNLYNVKKFVNNTW